ncbi:hypothetical protein [Parafrankia sp. BMG5.11]|uniref:hypothetical protein n=1 Tax=Parafrankia sp. BMG5.11 TaxID=222540 RepID=UPI001FB52E06|nr:hypothetical protein [Parafrankia sp. BMG5.11]
MAGPSRRPRRVWRRSGVAHIELRGHARMGVCGHAAVTAVPRGGELIDSPVLDYRTVRGVNSYSSLTPAREVADGCARLTEFCGVPFLGVDFKIDHATGEWFFLETNSMPCFEGYDERADGAISRAIVDWLSTPEC